MGVRITTDEHKAALFDSTSGTAFGPVFDSAGEAEAFLVWLSPVDPRELNASELEDRVWEFRNSDEGL